MEEEKHHHHHYHHHDLFHHKKDEETSIEGGVYSEGVVYSEMATAYTNAYSSEEQPNYSNVEQHPKKDEVDYKKEEKHHKHLEHLRELGSATAGAYALHERHKAEKNPEHAHRHKIEEGIAIAAAVESTGFTFHEHPEKEAKEEKKEAHGKKHHHLF